MQLIDILKIMQDGYQKANQPNGDDSVRDLLRHVNEDGTPKTKLLDTDMLAEQLVHDLFNEYSADDTEVDQLDGAMLIVQALQVDLENIHEQLDYAWQAALSRAKRTCPTS